MILSSLHKGLERFYRTGKTSGIQVKHTKRLSLILMEMHNPPHPGEIIGEIILEHLGISVTKAAEHLNVSRKTLSKIINGRGAITAEMALRLEKVFNKPTADHWLRMQNAHDLWHLKQGELDVTPYFPDAA